MLLAFFWDVAESIPFTNHRELIPLYEEAIHTDDVDLSTRMYWNDDALAARDLAQHVRRCRAQIATAPLQSFTVVDGVASRIYALA